MSHLWSRSAGSWTFENSEGRPAWVGLEDPGISFVNSLRQFTCFEWDGYAITTLKVYIKHLFTFLSLGLKSCIVIIKRKENMHGPKGSYWDVVLCEVNSEHIIGQVGGQGGHSRPWTPDTPTITWLTASGTCPGDSCYGDQGQGQGHAEFQWLFGHHCCCGILKMATEVFLNSLFLFGITLLFYIF